MSPREDDGPCGRTREPVAGVAIRFRGRVQGVGFRPMVWRIATEMGLAGTVLNDAEGVLVTLAGDTVDREGFVRRVRADCPPLGRIDAVEIRATAVAPAEGFAIAASRTGPAAPEIAPDAATCPACLAEIDDPGARRHGYAFTTCTRCGPRLSIVTGTPYDRARTTMARFPLCDACAVEYGDPADRRFHAEPIACPACGPRLWIERAGTGQSPVAGADLPALAAGWFRDGLIVGLKGLGGYQLACRATDEAAVDRLRRLKRRPTKPFALMARTLDAVRRHAIVTDDEAALLTSAAAPIVLLRRHGDILPETIAPGLDALGFMLAHTPLHHLLLGAAPEPVVMTSGNLTGAPQIIDDDAARADLGPVLDILVGHDRPIAVRVDDSVVRMVAGRTVTIRRGRGFAPASLPLPHGFATAPAVTAVGGDLKNAPCLLGAGRAFLAQHVGDLSDARTLADAERLLATASRLNGHVAAAIAVDLHPDYAATRLGERLARAEGLPLVRVQHHHAHLASVLAEHGIAADDGPVPGFVLDGTGHGADGTAWGCELLLADYRRAERLACLRPTPLPGGDAAAREPWRCLAAAILTTMGWDAFAARHGGGAVHRRLAERPIATIDAMIRRGLNAPPSSSAGRLFDAVAAALGLADDAVGYEAEAAMRLEALAGRADPADPVLYPFEMVEDRTEGTVMLSPATLWPALLDDLSAGVPSAVIALRFHRSFAAGLAGLLTHPAIRRRSVGRRIALSGGVMQNALLGGDLVARLEGQGFHVITPTAVPAGDGGLALGQAVVAAARLRA